MAQSDWRTDWRTGWHRERRNRIAKRFRRSPSAPGSGSRGSAAAAGGPRGSRGAAGTGARARSPRGGSRSGRPGRSCAVISRCSRRIWIGWTVVATVVWSSILPASISSPYSRSEKPPPLPTRAPLRLTATEPQRTKSISGSSSSATTRPCRSAPLIVAASRTCLAESLRGSSSRKGCGSRSRGTAMISVLPSSSARAPGVGLRRVRVHLDHLGALPEPVAGELLGRELGAGEVRDPALGPGKAGDPLAVHRLPDVPADLVLGPHQVRIAVGDMASGHPRAGAQTRAVHTQRALRYVTRARTRVTRNVEFDRQGNADLRRSSARKTEHVTTRS